MQNPEQPLSVGKAILIGHLMVNLPVMVIILCAAGIGALLAGLAGLIEPALARWFWAIVSIAVIAGSGCAWLWWSFAVPRWRKWALQNGAPADRLQKWAVATGLVWPKGWIFEKTESKVD